MPLDQKVAAPYGNIFFSSTPKTDRFIENHEAEERQQELLRQRQVDDMDKQLASHLGNVLNPDIPEIIQSYQDYKQSRKEQLFNDKLQKDPNAYAQKQIETNQKLATYMQTVGDSADRKKLLTGQLQEYAKSPWKFDDNFYEKHNLSLTTPTAYAKTHPGFDDHKWQVLDMDFSKSIKDAAGKQHVLKTTYSPVGSGGEYRLPTNVYGTNTPEEFLTTLNAKMSDGKYSYNAKKTFQNMSPEFVQQVNEHYAALPDDKFANWGYKSKPNLDPANPSDPVQQFNSIQAKTYAINHQFETRDGRQEANPDVKRQLNWAEKVKMLGLRGNQWASHEAVRQKNRLIVKSTGKSGGSEDDAFMVEAAPEVFKSGDQQKINYLLGNFATGGAKGIDGVKVGMEAPANSDNLNPLTSPFVKQQSLTPAAPVPTVRYVKNTFVYDKADDGSDKTTGHFELVPHVIQFDPESKNLKEDVVKAINEVKGKDLKLTRRVYNKDKITGAVTPVDDNAAPVKEKPAKAKPIKVKQGSYDDLN